MIEKLQAIDTRHVDIADHKSDVFAGNHIERVCAVCGFEYAITFIPQQTRENAAQQILVFGYKACVISHVRPPPSRSSEMMNRVLPSATAFNSPPSALIIASHTDRPRPLPFPV